MTHSKSIQSTNNVFLYGQTAQQRYDRLKAKVLTRFERNNPAGGAPGSTGAPYFERVPKAQRASNGGSTLERMNKFSSATGANHATRNSSSGQRGHHGTTTTSGRNLQTRHYSLHRTHNDVLREVAVGEAGVEAGRMDDLIRNLDAGRLKELHGGPQAALRQQLSGAVEQLMAELRNRQADIQELVRQARTQPGGVHKSRIARLEEAYSQQNKQYEKLEKLRDGLLQNTPMFDLAEYARKAVKAQERATENFGKATFIKAKYADKEFVREHPMSTDRRSASDTAMRKLSGFACGGGNNFGALIGLLSVLDNL